MILALLVFVMVAGGVFGVYWLVTTLPDLRARRELDKRLRDVSVSLDPAAEASILKTADEGVLPSIDRVIAGMGVGSYLSRLIEQSGSRTSPSTIIVMTIIAASAGAFLTATFIRLPFAPLGDSAVCGVVICSASSRGVRRRPALRTAARSATFFSSRTLPGQWYVSSSAIASSETRQTGRR